jgi:hypothetical protein
MRVVQTGSRSPAGIDPDKGKGFSILVHHNSHFINRKKISKVVYGRRTGANSEDEWCSLRQDPPTSLFPPILILTSQRDGTFKLLG